MDATVWPSRALFYKSISSFKLVPTSAPRVHKLVGKLDSLKLEIWPMDMTMKSWVNKPWHRGPLSIDEGINVMQSTCTGNSATVAFIMLPQYHSSTSKSVVLKNRRLLEDKIVGCLDTFEISMHYSDAGHGGDRRKKSQQCYFDYVKIRFKIPLLLFKIPHWGGSQPITSATSRPTETQASRGPVNNGIKLNTNMNDDFRNRLGIIPAEMYIYIYTNNTTIWLSGLKQCFFHGMLPRTKVLRLLVGIIRMWLSKSQKPWWGLWPGWNDHESMTWATLIPSVRWRLHGVCLGTKHLREGAPHSLEFKFKGSSLVFSIKTNPFKVQQRGVRASKGIINQLLADVDAVAKQPVLIVDVLPNRLGTLRKEENSGVVPNPFGSTWNMF